jgi:hypothetical protein
MSVAEAGKAVGGFFDVMRSQPLALALVVMNFALLAYIFWTGRNAMEHIYKANSETQQLLAKCVSVDIDTIQKILSKQSYKMQSDDDEVRTVPLEPR